MKKAGPLIAVVVATLCSLGIMVALGCDKAAAFVDVSAEPAYKKLVGARYELRVPMHLSGVNAPPGYEKTIDYYVLNPATPGWSGPELITRRTLAPGTLVTVKSVRRCTNCPFESRMQALVEIQGVEIEARFPVSISLDHLKPDFTQESASAAP